MALRMRTGKLLIASWIGTFVLISHSGAESLSICALPNKLPIDTPLPYYSPRLCFAYSGLKPGASYTLKVWLLTPGIWHCASTQWCERLILIDNSGGTNSDGRIEFVEPFDVFNYSRFDWVLRLFDASGAEVAFTEQYVDGTSNRAPVLQPIGSKSVTVGQLLTFSLSASDPDEDLFQFFATSLPAGSRFDSPCGSFSWTPESVGTFRPVFTVIDAGDGTLGDSEAVVISISGFPLIVEGPHSRLADPGDTFSLEVSAIGAPTLRYQWQHDSVDMFGETNSTLKFVGFGMEMVGTYQVRITNDYGAVTSSPATVEVFVDRASEVAAEAALEYLRNVMDEFHFRIPIYQDIGSPGNRFHARGKIPASAPVDIDGSWSTYPYRGATCIRCVYTNTGVGSFGGFYFLNGLLFPDQRAPSPYFGTAIDPGSGRPVGTFSGFDLRGVTNISFWARGERGGETIDIFFAGVGWDEYGEEDPQSPFRDSMPRYPPYATELFLLRTNWQHFNIDVSSIPPEKLTNIMGGFAWVASSVSNPSGAVFYLDEIELQLDSNRKSVRLSEPRFLRSFSTLPVQTLPQPVGDFDFVLRNTAFTYDNALALLALLSSESGKDLERAELIGDAFVYAMTHDRTFNDGRLRSAYAAGDIGLPSGWLPNSREYTVPVPGFYDEKTRSFYETAEASIVDTGNNTWAMIALLALYENTHDTKYLNAATRLGEFVSTLRNPVSRFEGFQGGIEMIEAPSPIVRTWSSQEHNIDAYAAFIRLAGATGDSNWLNEARHAAVFVEAMWDARIGCFGTGTTNLDGISTFANRLPVDVQAWGLLAIPSVRFAHLDVLKCSEVNHENESNGFLGFDFNQDRDAVWFEGTAQMAAAYAWNYESEKAERFKRSLRRAQLTPGFGDGSGIAAASKESLTTGFGFNYFRRLHVGATAWNVFAQRGFNPYYNVTASAVPRLTVDRDSLATSVTIRLRGQPKFTYTIRKSLDLIDWIPIWSGTLPPDSFELVQSFSVAQQSAFFRADVHR